MYDLEPTFAINEILAEGMEGVGWATRVLVAELGELFCLLSLKQIGTRW